MGLLLRHTEASVGQILTKTALAKMTGRSIPAVDGWIRRGLPVLGRNGPRGALRISSPAAIAWLADHQAAVSVSEPAGPLDLDEQRAREASERADRYSLENARSRRELIPARRVESLWAAMRARVRARVLAIPTRAEGPLADASPAALEGVLRLLGEALGELDGPAVPGAEEPAEPEGAHG